jgi:hypothetical protein
MSVSQPSLTGQAAAAAKSWAWLEPLLGLTTGALGGAIQSKILSAPIGHSILLGGILGSPAVSSWPDAPPLRERA